MFTENLTEPTKLDKYPAKGNKQRTINGEKRIDERKVSIEKKKAGAH